MLILEIAVGALLGNLVADAALAAFVTWRNDRLRKAQYAKLREMAEAVTADARAASTGESALD